MTDNRSVGSKNLLQKENTSEVIVKLDERRVRFGEEMADDASVNAIDNNVAE